MKTKIEDPNCVYRVMCRDSTGCVIKRDTFDSVVFRDEMSARIHLKNYGLEQRADNVWKHPIYSSDTYSIEKCKLIFGTAAS